MKLSKNKAKSLIQHSNLFLINLLKDYIEDPDIKKHLKKTRGLKNKRKYLTGGAILPIVATALGTLINLITSLKT